MSRRIASRAPRASDLTARVKQCALDHGFDLARVTTAEPFLRDERAAVERVRQGLMDGLPWYTEERVRKANRPQSLLEGAKSVVSLAVSYNTGEPDTENDAPRGKVARYAWGDDYHELLKPRLRRFADALTPLAGREVRTRVFVDDGPMNDRAAAARSGLGWFGKNTNILTPTHGSWVFLGQVITDLELEPDAPLAKTCGNCVRCIDDCPTGAIVAPYVIDNRKCISFLTIELRGAIPRELRPLVGAWVFGCDICQDVCPVNRKARLGGEPAFRQRGDFAAPAPHPAAGAERAGVPRAVPPQPHPARQAVRPEAQRLRGAGQPGRPRGRARAGRGAGGRRRAGALARRVGAGPHRRRGGRVRAPLRPTHRAERRGSRGDSPGARRDSKPRSLNLLEEFALQRVRLWKVVSDGPPREISGSGISLEERLEDWLAADVSMLDPGLLVIGRQVRTDHGGIIDLLCLDSAGDCVVVELKKGHTPREVVAQVLDYASWVQGLSNEKIEEIANAYLREDGLAGEFPNKFGVELPGELNLAHRCLVVAESIDASTERIVRYLAAMGVPLNVATVQHFSDDDGRGILAQVYLVETDEDGAPPRSSRARRSIPRLNDLQKQAYANGVGELYAQMRAGVRGILAASAYIDRVFYQLRREDGSVRTVLIVRVVSCDDGLCATVHATRLESHLGMELEQLVGYLPSNFQDEDVTGWPGSAESERKSAKGLSGSFQSPEEVDKFVNALRKAIDQSRPSSTQATSPSPAFGQIPRSDV